MSTWVTFVKVSINAYVPLFLLNVYIEVKSRSYAISVCSNTVDNVKPFSKVVVSVASQQYCMRFLVAPISNQNFI